MTAQEQVTGMIEKARAAQKKYEAFNQEQVDAIVRATAKAINDHAEELAHLDFEETAMGNFEHKLMKTSGRPKVFWYHLKNKKSRGILRYLDDVGIVEVAKPLGIIGSITPVTSPVLTPLHNTMIALKGGNAVIICPHPRAKKIGGRVVDLMSEAIRPLGAPENLIQIISEPTMELSTLVMQTTDVCISTGGGGLVKVAYSSGKPAFGVGAGNVQCLVDRGMDTEDVVEKVIQSRMFDNGIPCGAEQFIHCPREKFDEFADAFGKLDAYYIGEADKVDRIRQTAFPGGAMNKDMVGKLPFEIAKAAGIDIPESTRVLALKVEKYGKDEPLAKEKLFPVIALRAYDTWEEAVDCAETNLDMEGKGHSTMIHSNDKDHVEYAALKLSVSRFGVNQSSSKCVGGTLTNGLAPTGTLGCGSWGNNSISENLDYHHMMNVSRIVYEIPDAVVPTDEEIWA